MKLPLCPSLKCSLPIYDLKPGRVVRSGFYLQKYSRRSIQRYRCKSCGASFSSQTFSSTYYQKRPELNLPVRNLLCSQVSLRRAAWLLGVNRKTVTRKFRFMARQAALENERRREILSADRVSEVQFDDLLTSIHTKCKPVSVSLAVHAKTREILGFELSDIPARHPLVEVAWRKYGPRKDERPHGLNRLFRKLTPLVHPDARIRSDCDPEYPAHVCRYFPFAAHERSKSRRARTAGFGELKRIGFDPLYSLNHTCAMLRANLNRLARRTWCTTKTRIGLFFHLELYMQFHNANLPTSDAVLYSSSSGWGAPPSPPKPRP